MEAVKKWLTFLICLAVLGGIVYGLMKYNVFSNVQKTVNQNPNNVQSTVDPNVEPLSGKKEKGHLQRTETSPVENTKK